MSKQLEITYKGKKYKVDRDIESFTVIEPDGEVEYSNGIDVDVIYKRTILKLKNGKVVGTV